MTPRNGLSIYSEVSFSSEACLELLVLTLPVETSYFRSVHNKIGIDLLNWVITLTVMGFGIEVPNLLSNSMLTLMIMMFGIALPNLWENFDHNMCSE